MLDLDETLSTPLDDRVKGIPGGVRSLPLASVGEQGWNVLAEDLPLPLLVLRRSDVLHNVDLMQRYCEAFGALLAPHGKTTMAPQLFDLQLARGAWAITAASVQQVQVYRRAGVERIVFANQLVGRPNLAYIATQLKRDPELELYTWVDSEASVELLVHAAREFGLDRRWRVLLEIGYVGGRSGVRDRRSADNVARYIRRHEKEVELVGISGFEGLLATERLSGTRIETPSDLPSQREYLSSVAAIAEHLYDRAEVPPAFLLSAGGSTSFDAVVEAFSPLTTTSARLLLRSGCYITHDHFMNATTSPLREGATEAQSLGHLLPALELWTYVHSLPEPGLALLTAGRRDAPFDYGLPVPLRSYPPTSSTPRELSDAKITAVNDQHLYLRHATRIEIGERVVLGISHPCTAFDKWRFIPVVDDEYNVVDGVLTYF